MSHSKHKLVQEDEPTNSVLCTAKWDVRVSPDEGRHWFTAAYVMRYRNGWVRPWFTEAEGRRIAAWPTTSEYDEVIEYHPERPAAERFTHIRPAYPDMASAVTAIPVPGRPDEYVYGIGHRYWLWAELAD
jgi:hypothetical protein